MPDHSVDLKAYFTRIGYTGPREPTLVVLQGILFRHACSIPFENLDVLLGRSIPLDVPALERKLVHDRRGGYCFEHNILLSAVLRALGFTLTWHLARVRWKVPAGQPTPLTHLVLEVTIDRRPWLADAGFGGVGLTVPLALDTEDEQADVREPRRLLRQGREVMHQVRLGADWTEVYRFTLDEACLVDCEVGNWFTSTHPRSRFKNNLMVARVAPDGRYTLQNRELTFRRPDGRAEKREIATPDELLDVLAKHFDLRFPAGTRFGLPDSPWPG